MVNLNTALRDIYDKHESARKLYRKSRELKRLTSTIPSIIEVAKNTKNLHGRKSISRSTNDCIVVSVVRNGESYIKEFIEHHLALGFKHIFLLDNGSEDSTIDISKQYKEVSVFQCRLPFKHYKNHMRSYLLNRFSFGKWCLLVDVDEFFDYPCRDAVSLTQFIEYLEQRRDSAVMVQMLDMYPACSLQALIDKTHQNFIKYHNFFELSTIDRRDISEVFDYQVDNQNIKIHYGGVRKRLFDANPILSKLALIKPNWHSYQVNPHWRSSAKISDISCVFFHYKFIDSFASVVEKAVSKKQYYQDSCEYMNYHRILKQQKDVDFLGDSSLEFKDIDQLVVSGFMQVSEAYDRFANQQLLSLEKQTPALKVLKT
jgi:hypothetical protein